MKVELRADRVVIDGYVNAVARESRPISSPRGRFIERVEPQAFQRALDRAEEIELRLNHRRPVGSTADGSLSLYEDAIGLRAHAEISDPEVMEKARGGELRGWSFGFRAAKDIWEERAGALPLRKLTDFEMDEVSLIDRAMTPCYAATSVEVRADGDVFTETRMTEDIPEVQGEKDPAEGNAGGDALPEDAGETERGAPEKTGYSRRMAENKIKILKMRGRRA